MAARPSKRLAACSVLVVFVFGALAVRVTQLQVFSGDRYRLASLEQTVHTVYLPAQRGTIFDRNGRDLAMSIELSAVYADPQQVWDPIVSAAELAPVLHVSDQFLQTQLSDTHYKFRYLAHQVSDSVVAKVQKLDLPGIGVEAEPAREYPAGALAGSIIGQLGEDPHGTTGLEEQYQSLLQGRPGQLVVARDQQGLDIPNTATHEVEARRGTDIVLSLDEPLQWETEQSLIDEVAATNARGGEAVVVDTTDGDVLAMASIDGATGNTPPHPSTPTEATRPLMDLFEPGSTNKLITLSTAIQDGVVTPDTEIDVPSALQVGPTQFTDVDPHGDVHMTVTDILRQSSNIGTIEVAQRLGKDRLSHALRSFGLGAPTSVQFPGQASGLLLDPSHYYATGLASTAIGYGVAVTAMQMLDAYVTIANGGVTRPPHLLDATIDADGIRHPANVSAGHRVVSAHTAAQMSGMLASVVSAGTGACAAIPGYTIAGKTGTARKAVDGGYSTGTMASFIGYAPATHPKLAAIVVLDEPTSTYGGTVAAPVFADVMQFALTHEDVAPDDPGNVQFDAARASAAASGTTCVDPAAAAAAAASQTEARQAATASTTTVPVPQAAALRGPTGPSGVSGPSGPTGPSGSTGPSGVSGPSGGTGSTGNGIGVAPPTPGTLPDHTSKSG
ncbi:MAG: peptidoglycan D,D-transpeptidase FtsI family protein [Acidimicrobiia bacterium]